MQTDSFDRESQSGFLVDGDESTIGFIHFIGTSIYFYSRVFVKWEGGLTHPYTSHFFLFVCFGVIFFKNYPVFLHEYFCDFNTKTHECCW